MPDWSAMRPTADAIVFTLLYFVFVISVIVNCVKKRTIVSEKYYSLSEKPTQTETIVDESKTPETSDRTTSATSGSTNADPTTSSAQEKEDKVVEDHTGDTYKEIRPKASASKYPNKVQHIDRTDMVALASLSEEEQKILLRAMSRGGVKGGVENGSKEAVVNKVYTVGTTDEITLQERELPESVGDLNLDNVVPLDNLLIRMVQNGPRQFKFDYQELKELLEKGTEVFSAECSLLDVNVPCVIYGDIHGQYSDLHRWFNLNGWPNRTRTVFLGDFVDRGSHGIEVVAMLTLLKLHFPENIFVVRGNHEEESLNKAYSFYEEVVARFTEEESKPKGQQMYSAFKKLFMHLPLAVLVGKRILGMHGGISPKMRCLQDIRNIKRPIDDFEVGSLECDLVWSDPDTGHDGQGFRPNLEREPQNGIGQLFGEECVKEACDRLGIDLMIRGHQAPLYGYAFFAGGKMMTLFSAPGYKGSTENDINMGACVEVNTDLQLTIKQLKVSQKFRKNRIADMDKTRLWRKKVLR
ncbi:unnamed protein product [Bursaphelenchus okinawaensis]|uniref:Serine/threonine-protein phosphatase n=1 Tax=Bursaphelenchus okinawaensis TaxID=465554 RepID=A0A811LRB2_9BILA|nr:unnamed protein product [Bursaphelenchus okinawaensis]CAG9127033.1 unnamed protein product [Bursaphelenchus okinawaensis]